jgi:hypothetical protein
MYDLYDSVSIGFYLKDTQMYLDQSHDNNFQ